MADSPLDTEGLRSLHLGKTSANSRSEMVNYFPREDSHHSYSPHGHFLKRKCGGFDQYIEAMVEVLLVDSVESFLYLYPQGNFSIREQSSTNYLVEFLGRQEVDHSTTFQRIGTNAMLDSDSNSSLNQGEASQTGNYLENKKDLGTLWVSKEGSVIMKGSNLIQSEAVSRNMKEREGGSEEIGPQVWADGEREGEMEDWERNVKGKEGEGEEWLPTNETVKGDDKQDREGVEEGEQETDEDESEDEDDEDKDDDEEEIISENDVQRPQIRFTLKTVEVHPQIILEPSSNTTSPLFQDNEVVPAKLLLDETVTDKNHLLVSPVKTDVETEERPLLPGNDTVEETSCSDRPGRGDLVEKTFVSFTSELPDQHRAAEIDSYETKDPPFLSEEGRDKTIKDSQFLSEKGGSALLNDASVVTSDEKGKENCLQEGEIMQEIKILRDRDNVARTPELETEGKSKNMTESGSSRVESTPLSGNLGEGEVIPLEELIVSKRNEVDQTFSEGPRGNRKKWQLNLGGQTVMSGLLSDGYGRGRENGPTQEVDSQDNGTSFREQDDAVTEIEKEKGGGRIAQTEEEIFVESLTVFESDGRREAGETNFVENINSGTNSEEDIVKVLPEVEKPQFGGGGKQEALVEDEIDVKEMVSHVPLEKIMVVEPTVEIAKRGSGNEFNQEVDFQQLQLTSDYQIGADMLGQTAWSGVDHVLEEEKLVEVEVSEVLIPLKNCQVEKLEDKIEKNEEGLSTGSGDGDSIETELPISDVSSLQHSVPVSLVTEVDDTPVDKPYLLKDLNEVVAIPLSKTFVRVNSTHFAPPAPIPAAFLAPLQRVSTEIAGTGSFVDERLKADSQKDSIETITEAKTGTSTSLSVMDPTISSVSTPTISTKSYSLQQDSLKNSVSVHSTVGKYSPKKEKEEEKERNVHAEKNVGSTKMEVLRGEKIEGQPQPIKTATVVISNTSTEDFVSVAKKGGFACCFRPQVKGD